jgi:hypothetical protein
MIPNRNLIEQLSNLLYGMASRSYFQHLRIHLKSLMKFNDFTPDEINDYFVSISMPSPNDNDRHHIIKPPQLDSFSSLSFDFTEVIESELRAAWKLTKNKKTSTVSVQL